MMTLKKPTSVRKTDQGEVAVYDQTHGMPYFVAEETDKPSGYAGEMRRISHLAVRRVTVKTRTPMTASATTL